MKKTVHAVLALVALAALPYVPGLRHPFVYDDHGAIVENRFLAERANARHVLALRTVRDPRVLDGQRPTLLLSMILDRGAGAPSPWRFRLTNLALHAGTTLLLFFWLAGLPAREGAGGGFRGAALVAALVFAIHPLLSEAVQVPSYREDLLFLFFWCAFLLAARIPRAAVRWPAQVVALVLAAGAKESVAMAPALLAWIWWCFPSERPPRRAAVACLVAVTLVVAGYVALAYGARPLQASGGPWNGLSLRWPENVWTAPWLWVRYLGLLAAPWPLVADRVVAPVLSPGHWKFLAGAIALLATAAAAVLARRRHPWLALGLGWMLLAFAPVSNLVPLFNPLADRYAYAMAPGFAMLVAAGLARREGLQWRRLALATLAVAYVLLVQLRLQDWRSDEALWSATLRAEPRSARAHTWLGLELLAQGHREEARGFFERAEALNPQDVTALVNLAIMDGQTGGLARATAQLREAVLRRPDKPEAWANLAVSLELQGEREEALRAAERAAALDPLR